MRMKALALCLMTGFAATAAAQDSTLTLRQALKQMPQVVLSSTDAMQIVFLDVQAWRGLEPAAPSADGMRRLSIARQIRPLESIGSGLQSWSENAKVPFDEVAFFAGFGRAPANISYWGLKNKEAVGELVASLKRIDFAAVEGDAPGLIANDNEGKMNLQKANQQDPWRGMMGMPSFVLPLDRALIQASSAKGMQTLAQPTPSVADSEIVAASLAGLKEGVPADRGQIVQAAVISPIMGLAAVDPAKVLLSTSVDADIAKQNLKAAVEANRQGIPPYFSGILADAQVNKLPAVVISLAYADCATARQAVDGIRAAWKQSMAGAKDAKVAGTTVQAGKLCAAVVRATAPKADDAGNPVLAEVMNRYMRREFTLLQIGTAP